MRTVLSVMVCIGIGAALNVAVAWGLAAVQGEKGCEWKPHHNPREGNPVVFFVNRAPGVEWVVGCGRPGTLLSRNPEAVERYRGLVWWPAEAVTFDDKPCAVAAGWPWLSFSAWRTTDVRPLGIDEFEYVSVHHWGLCVSESTLSAWEAFPLVLPLRPMWAGVIGNTLVYAVVLMGVFRGAGWARRRRRVKRGLCAGCGYPRGVGVVCPECGAGG